MTAVKQGQNSATYFWPGSEAPIMGVRPTYYLAYNQSTSYGTRVQQVFLNVLKKSNFGSCCHGLMNLRSQDQLFYAFILKSWIPWVIQ